MPRLTVRLACLAFSAMGLAVGTRPVAAAAGFIEIRAGDFDRRQTPIRFQLPRESELPNRLVADSGQVIPLQIDAHGRAEFILPVLGRRATAKFCLDRQVQQITPAATALHTGSKVEFALRGRSVLNYQAEPGPLPRPEIDAVFRRGGYLHPIRTPLGKIVTDDFPLNHVHHHGVWFAWTSTQFDQRKPDFWNMGQKKGTIEPVGSPSTWSGPVSAGLSSNHRFVDLTGVSPTPVLNETWRIEIFAVEDSKTPFNLFDLTSIQECASDKALVLPEYHYGGIGLRGAWDWNGEEQTFFLTANGETDRIKGHSTRARWCHMGGRLGGELAGVAILCHPENFRAPQPMRIHPSEPFFCYAPQQGGSMEIAPGQKYVSRYRFVVGDGAPSKEELDRLWNDYAFPPEVKFVR